MSAEQPLLQMRGVYRKFPSGEDTVTVLRDIDLTIDSGELEVDLGNIDKARLVPKFD